ncbi:SDR family oxidoreductase [Gordonia polyisoprenivorans]|uniref:SDR family oxidoreductase n=1 Tax=Gordonia polyisoprenivorans TaxID=84595 RepID=UPI002300FE0F|nr:SDR family oxidoreductase [Gordonia polyisoprenivorans]WCB35355.1 SDR family oxidoreductase [Gordonia polyisoprenivorans]
MGALEGRVAVITGAGRGIGREHALLFAREGAAVIVNDLGGSNSGDGTDVTPAQETVNDIIAAGGRAAVNTENIATWAGAEALIAQAIDEFGGIDVVVNNAGILRDAFIPTMNEADWDAVVAVHLKGHFSVIHHAAAYWKSESKAGRQPNAAIVNTASASGVTVPNAGQSNYGAAKAGIAALTQVAADELQRYGVRANAIAPIARTRLTLATPDMGALMAAEAAEAEAKGGFDAFAPANISPLVAYLATADCPITGKVFAVQGGAISELAGWHDIKTIETDQAWAIDDIAARLP